MKDILKIFAPEITEQHTINTLDNNGTPITLNTTITQYKGDRFKIKGNTTLGRHPVTFLNRYGDDYEKCVVLGISVFGQEQVLFGSKGYIQFHSPTDTDEFTGQQISYSK